MCTGVLVYQRCANLGVNNKLFPKMAHKQFEQSTKTGSDGAGNYK